MHSELKIRTPEGIVFSYALAGPVTRFLAWLVDTFLTTAIAIASASSLSWGGLLAPDLVAAAGVLVYFIITLGYGIVLESSWRGQTLGKRMLRLRVLDDRGMRLRFHQILLRNLLRAIDMLPVFYFVGGCACLLSRRAQRIGDLVAGTVVVRNPRFREPDIELLLGTKYNSLREYPHLAARLRQRVSPAEAKLALEALVRRERLAPAARVEVFRELAAHFDRHVTFPAELRELLSDEQFVRNVADILFRTSMSPAGSQKLESAGV